MTIGPDDLVLKAGSQTILGTGTRTGMADNALSAGTTDINVWANTDGAPFAMFTLQIDWNTNPPDVGTFVYLIARKMDVTDAGLDDVVPTATFPNDLIGAFPVKNVTTNQVITIGPLTLPNFNDDADPPDFEFYLWNKTGETPEDGFDLTIRPLSVGPHAA